MNPSIDNVRNSVISLESTADFVFPVIRNRYSSHLNKSETSESTVSFSNVFFSIPSIVGKIVFNPILVKPKYEVVLSDPILNKVSEIFGIKKDSIKKEYDEEIKKTFLYIVSCDENFDTNCELLKKYDEWKRSCKINSVRDYIVEVVGEDYV